MNSPQKRSSGTASTVLGSLWLAGGTGGQKNTNQVVIGNRDIGLIIGLAVKKGVILTVSR